MPEGATEKDIPEVEEEAVVSKQKLHTPQGLMRLRIDELLKMAKEATIRADVNAYIGRKRRKRDFRRLWIVRLNAACKQHRLRYSRFIHGCKNANIQLNRKMLSEIAIDDPAGFDAIVEVVKGAVD